MGHTTVRISESAREILRTLAHSEGRPMQTLLDEAVEGLRRRRFLEEVNEAYASLRRDAVAWSEIEKERRGWEATLLDGLEVRRARGKRGAPARKRGKKR